VRSRRKIHHIVKKRKKKGPGRKTFACGTAREKGPGRSNRVREMFAEDGIVLGWSVKRGLGRRQLAEGPRKTGGSLFDLKNFGNVR